MLEVQQAINDLAARDGRGEDLVIWFANVLLCISIYIMRILATYKNRSSRATTGFVSWPTINAVAKTATSDPQSLSSCRFFKMPNQDSDRIFENLIEDSVDVW